MLLRLQGTCGKGVYYSAVNSVVSVCKSFRPPQTDLHVSHARLGENDIFDRKKCKGRTCWPVQDHQHRDTCIQIMTHRCKDRQSLIHTQLSVVSYRINKLFCRLLRCVTGQHWCWSSSCCRQDTWTTCPSIYSLPSVGVGKRPWHALTPQLNVLFLGGFCFWMNETLNSCYSEEMIITGVPFSEMKSVKFNPDVCKSIKACNNNWREM